MNDWDKMFMWCAFITLLFAIGKINPSGLVDSIFIFLIGWYATFGYLVYISYCSWSEARKIMEKVIKDGRDKRT